MSEARQRTVSIDVDAIDLMEGQGERGTPERNLLMAILERAILDFVGNDKKEVEQAESWMFSDDEEGKIEDDSDSLSPFSFPWICQQLDLDKTFVADTILAMPKRGNRRVAPWYFMKSDNYVKQAS